jgi:hypothetical protein
MKNYLHGLGKEFIFVVNNLIQKNIRESNHFGNDEIDSEIIHHALICNRLNENFIDRDKIVETVI